MAVWFACCSVCFAAVSGGVYDYYHRPALMGKSLFPDPTTGTFKDIVFQKGTVTRQFFIEGLAAGAAMVAAGLGIVFVRWGRNNDLELKSMQRFRFLLSVGGLALFVGGYHLLNIFFTLKVPGYLSFPRLRALLL